jgi:hypothetical protein
VIEVKRESERKGKIASGWKYHVVFAYGGRFAKTPLMLYIEMRAYVQGRVCHVAKRVKTLSTL